MVPYSTWHIGTVWRSAKSSVNLMFPLGAGLNDTGPALPKRSSDKKLGCHLASLGESWFFEKPTYVWFWKARMCIIFQLFLKNIFFQTIFKTKTPQTLSPPPPSTPRRPHRGILGGVCGVFDFQNILKRVHRVLSKVSDICTSMFFRITHVLAVQRTMIP